MSGRQVFVGRQPILDRNLGVLGYELLFRDDPSADSARAQGDRATSRVIVNTFAEFGLDRLVGDKLAFVNMTRPFLVGTLPLPFRAGEVVLEVIDGVDADDDLVAGVRRLVDSGYAIAVDENAARLLPLATYAKIDVLNREPRDVSDGVAAVLAAPRDAGLGPIRLVAERVESRPVMAECESLGFHYFQGYLLARPSVVSSPALTPSTITCMELLNRLTEPGITFEALEEVVRMDVGLSYRVLRAVNSAASGLVRPVSSVRDALVMLGVKQLRSWVLLMVLADATEGEDEQLAMALTRARMCELLVPHFPGAPRESAFLVGLLSSLEFLLGTPMTEVVDRLPLESDVVGALLHREGPLGSMLDVVVAYEMADLEAIAASPVDLGLLSPAYLDAVGWSRATVERVSAA